jgi:hypothetical protein
MCAKVPRSLRSATVVFPCAACKSLHHRPSAAEEQAFLGREHCVRLSSDRWLRKGKVGGGGWRTKHHRSGKHGAASEGAAIKKFLVAFESAAMRAAFLAAAEKYMPACERVCVQELKEAGVKAEPTPARDLPASGCVAAARRASSSQGLSAPAGGVA